MELVTVFCRRCKVVRAQENGLFSDYLPAFQNGQSLHCPVCNIATQHTLWRYGFQTPSEPTTPHPDQAASIRAEGYQNAIRDVVAHIKAYPANNIGTYGVELGDALDLRLSEAVRRTAELNSENRLLREQKSNLKEQLDNIRIAVG